jgi:F0F1-type ATP synthase membrane subunit b/b'
MNIQPNILIWTVVCFCLFMLVLWRMLLRPLLKLMDAREAKLARARSLDKTAERAALASRREQERQEALRRMGEERQRAARALREQAQAELSERELEYRRETIRRREELEAEAEALVPELATSLKDHVDAFTDRLTAYGEQ